MSRTELNVLTFTLYDAIIISTFKLFFSTEALMKFCTSCGNEMFDDAVICTKCGRMAVMPQVQQPAPQAPQPTPVSQVPVQVYGVPTTKSKTINLTMTILNFISSIFTSFALFFLAGAALDGRVELYYYGNTYSTTIRSSDFRVYFYPDYDLMPVAFCFFIISFILCTTTFILSLVARERGEKLFSRISKLIFTFLFMIASLAF